MVLPGKKLLFEGHKDTPTSVRNWYPRATGKNLKKVARRQKTWFRMLEGNGHGLPKIWRMDLWSIYRE